MTARRERPRRGGLGAEWLGWAVCAAALAGFALVLVGWLAGGVAFSLPWAPTLDLRWSFALDGLGALYALLATGIGALVFAYGTRYLTLHLEHERRPGTERWRFWPWMALFAVAMVGLATAQDLVLLFVFFDLTAVCSYFLIGFDRARREARTAALMALLVTVVSAVAMLVAAVLLYATHGTFAIPELIERAEAGPVTTAAAALLAVAALAKSAQVPLHFWLPRAMAAPTPVSAYLHSAAMVAAGVLVLGRVHPLLARSEAVLTGLLAVGVASILVGGVLALSQDVLKQVLAYSTISQYGYMVMMYGLGSAAGNGAAAFYVIAHAIAKSALFMTAGAVTMATGEDRLSRLGGLARRMPVLAAAAGVAAASLAALPLTVGFFKDELFFTAALAAGPLTTVLAVSAAALTLAYIGRFWLLLFLGPPRVEARSSWVLVVPVAVLAVLSVLGGLVVAPFARLAGDAATVSNAAPVVLAPAYHLDARPENLMTLIAWALGGLLLVARRPVGWASRGLAAAGERWGPRRIYEMSLDGLARLSAALHDREVRDLRTSVAAVLVPAGVLIALAFAATPTAGAYRVGGLSGADWLVLPLLGLVVLVTLIIALSRARLAVVLALSVVGFALAAVYALIGAPDVALVAVVVETMLTLVFLAALARLPDHGPDRDRRAPVRVRSRRRDAMAGVVAGLAVFVTVWGFLSQPASTTVASDHIRLTPAAHGGDVVTVIVADFRGLDTLVEITVLLAAVVGVVALLGRGRPW
ncbi:hydrogen gas-evolving membrane-bound hydrogenase subunit E (plasmid) [Pseudonocardia bannensis]